MVNFESRPTKMVHRYYNPLPVFMASSQIDIFGSKTCLWFHEQFPEYQCPMVQPLCGSFGFEASKTSSQQRFRDRKRQPGYPFRHLFTHPFVQPMFIEYLFYSGHHVSINYIWNTNKSPPCPCVGWKCIGQNCHCLVLRQFLWLRLKP